MSENERIYAERLQRFNDIVALKKPDRVALMPQVVHYFPTHIRGVSNKEAGYNDEMRYQCMREADLEFGWDWAVPSGIFSSPALEALGIKQVQWPGGALPDDAHFQFVEDEYLREEEYDDFLADPSGFTVSRLMPRFAENLAGLAGVPPLYWFSGSFFFIGAGLSIAATPSVRSALESLLKGADAAEVAGRALHAHVAEMADLGYPWAYASATIPAFDMVSDFFRGLKGGSLDIYRNPDRLLATIELMEPMTIAAAIGAAKMSGNPRVFIPMHRGADNFMSEADFEKFYWPSFRRLIDALVAEGLTPMPLFEGHYDSRLKYLAELPAGKIAAHFDFIDHKKFKQTCGDVMCFWGDVPASLMCTGTPEQVKDYVKRLIELFSDTGALIIDANQGIPDQSKPENVMALRQAVDECGVF